MTAPATPLGLFEGFGLEIEWMIVDAETLDVRPVADELLAELAGPGATDASDASDGLMGWSNELVLHLIESKNEAPVPTLVGLGARFAASAARLGDVLSRRGLRLLSGGIHPWMDPRQDTRLWSGAYGDIYATYHRLFDCHRHGWANVQATHLNLPFGNDAEFAQLHAAARLVLPLIPGLSAASPIVQGRATGKLDNRLAFYRDNASRVPLMAGRVIPDPIGSPAEYQERILEPLYRQLEPLDPDGLLRYEFANARGVIARFDRNALEIRLIDAQECPRADVAVCALVAFAVRSLVEGRHASAATLAAWPTESLVDLLDRSLVDGPSTPLADPALGAALVGSDADAKTVGDIWRRLLEQATDLDDEHRIPLELITRRGTLAQRLLSELDGDVSRSNLRLVFGRVADCLRDGRLLGEGG